MTKQDEFIATIADMTRDNECLEHGDECGGGLSDCELFEMTNDDAVMTLNQLIATARWIKGP